MEFERREIVGAIVVVGGGIWKGIEVVVFCIIQVPVTTLHDT